MISTYFKILRPTQWLKNLMLFFPPFLAGVLLEKGEAVKGVVPIISFCLASSSTYVLNDIIDREKDLHHPRKKHRAIPSGKISLPVASILAVALLAAALFIGFLCNITFFVILLIYLLVSLSYSLKLKELPIIDLFCISAGFILRLQAGGVVFGINISEWLFLSVFLLSIFLSTGKRLYEKNAMGENAGNHRKTLMSYPAGYLDGTMYMTGGAVLVTYTMYVISKHVLVYTVPLCCFGILRYIYRVKRGLGGDPTDSLLRDVPLFIVGLLWVVMIGWCNYCFY
ncbi:MAG TPA: decaprenyl-phosphate phosphoribosyltransferase [Syntrophales bacterium]|nr:decaprenyl-phosphate phosphoribosyltransferase [Syntrophales bacterium]